MDVRHQVATVTSSATAVVGATVAGLSLADWQSIASIIACAVGVVLSCAAAWWRWCEHRERMRGR